jgi:hypothetical protein
MSQRVANVLFARVLSLLSVMVLLPAFLYTCVWFLDKAGIRFFANADSLIAPYHSLTALWVLGGPVLAIIVLALSVVIEQEPGTSALSLRWKCVSLIAAGILFFPVALALFVHAIVGT